MDIKKIWTGDYSKEGYDKGFSDGMHGKPKNKLSFVTAINPINYVLRYDNAFQSYMGKYDDGHLDANRKSNDLYSSTNQITGGNSMGTDSYARQLQVLNDAKDKMELLKKRISDLKESYAGQISYAENNAFMSDYAIQLRQKHGRFGTHIDEFITALNREKSMLEKHEAIIQRLRNQANN